MEQPHQRVSMTSVPNAFWSRFSVDFIFKMPVLKRMVFKWMWVIKTIKNADLQPFPDLWSGFLTWRSMVRTSKVEERVRVVSIRNSCAVPDNILWNWEQNAQIGACLTFLMYLNSLNLAQNILKPSELLTLWSAVWQARRPWFSYGLLGEFRFFKHEAGNRKSEPVWHFWCIWTP